MSKLAFCDYHNMVEILEKTEHNTDFHQIVDFLEASPLRVNSPSFSGRNVDLFESMLVPQGEGPMSLTPGADESASPPRDDSHGEAFPTATSLYAGQDRENIPKTSAMPHESSPEGGMMDQGEDFGIERDSNESTDKGSESTREMANVLSSVGAANILASGGLKEVFTTASPLVPPVSLFVPTIAATASEKDSTAAVITTTTTITPYTTRTRASRGVLMTSSSPIPINIPSISKEDKGKGIMT
ncbi:hypothetical protein Tco_1453241, partial [Tanacetum coccineum]